MATIVDGKMLTTLSKEVLEKYPNEILLYGPSRQLKQCYGDCGFKKIKNS